MAIRGVSYGFRQGRSQHDALDALTVGIKSQNVNWILDADITSFFDEIEHDWMLKFLAHRIADQRILGLIRKWLKAGVMEEGCRVAAQRGTPQGAVISPLLANIYLHYALDQWTHQWRGRHAVGRVMVVRYADDSVYGFQYEETARRFLAAMQERLGKFGLTLNAKKTRLIEFGRYAAANRKRRGQSKPETFDFLGFTHCCGTNGKGLVPAHATDGEEANAGNTEGHTGQTTAENARARIRCRQVAGPRGEGILQLPRCTGQPVPTGEDASRDMRHVAQNLEASQPAAQTAMGQVQAASQSIHTSPAHHAPLP